MTIFEFGIRFFIFVGLNALVYALLYKLVQYNKKVYGGVVTKVTGQKQLDMIAEEFNFNYSLIVDYKSRNYYDFLEKTLHLSSNYLQSKSVTARFTCAHEAFHCLQGKLYPNLIKFKIFFYKLCDQRYVTTFIFILFWILLFWESFQITLPLRWMLFAFILPKTVLISITLFLEFHCYCSAYNYFSRNYYRTLHVVEFYSINLLTYILHTFVFYFATFYLIHICW